MDGNTRFAGQEGVVALVNSTSQEALLADVGVKSWNFGAPFSITEEEFIGETGPKLREFADAITLELEVSWAGAEQTANYLAAMLAKARGASTDEFQAALKYRSLTGGTFRIVLRDLHSEGVPIDTRGRKEFTNGTLRFKVEPKNVKVEVV